MQQVHIVNTLWYWDQGLCGHTTKAQWMIKSRHCIWLCSDPSRQLQTIWDTTEQSRMLQSNPEQYGTTRTQLYPWKPATPTSGRLGGVSTPHKIPYLNAEYPWLPNCSLTPTTDLPWHPWCAMSYASLAPTGLACQHMLAFRHPRTCKTHPDTSRTVQLWSDHSGTL